MSPRSRTLALASGGALLLGALILGLSRRDPPAADPAPVSLRPAARPAQMSSAPTQARRPAEIPVNAVSVEANRLREQRLARAEMTLQAYLTATRYPPDSRPIDERPDLARPHQAPVRALPLARPDRAPTSARVTLRQDRYFAAGDEKITLGLTCSSACEVLSARAVLPPDMPGDLDPAPLIFSDDGQGGAASIFQPSRQGFSAYHGPIRVEVDLRVGQESGSASFDLHYTPAPPASFTGVVREAMVRGSLELYAGIKVDRPGRYIVRARVDDADGKPFAFLTDNEVLAAGAREARLRLFGKLVHDAHARAPFRLRDLEGFLLEESSTPDRANMVDLEGTIYTTRPYADGELSEAEWDSEEKANHLRELTRDVELASSDPPRAPGSGTIPR